ncbi:MAG: hypothetical protein RSC68_01205 [Acinetobacter sp.]
MQVGSLNSSILTKGKSLMNVSQPYQSPRQRVWIAIRKNRDEFTIQQVAGLGGMKYESTRDFVSCLNKAGIVEISSETPLHHPNCKVKQRTYKLVKDMGYTVPEVNRKGEILSSTTGNKAMWNTLRITKQSLNADELARISSTDDIQISPLTAREYLSALFKAGYLKITQMAKTTGGKAKYQILPEMNTGPNPPQIQRAKQVFDPNTNQLMYSERPELEEEIKHGTLLLNQEELEDE